MFLLFRKAKRMVEYPTTMAKICDYIAKMPASCYYLADSTAYRYVCTRIKAEKPKFGKYQAMKEKLFEDFYQDFLRLRQMDQYKEYNTKNLVYVCLNLPAPNLGMAPRYIQMKINNYFRNKKTSFITR